jgi:GT2 family glycosyltransferase
MPRELVSVVIPTYNRARLLPVAVQSALGQTHPDVEVLVADDGSTDGTRELVAGTWAGDARVRYLHQPNAGVAAARNLALRAAQGDFVALLDSDDSWFPWKLELQLACLRAFPLAGMVWTDMDSYRPDHTLLTPRYLRHMYSAWKDYDADTLFQDSRALREVVPGLAREVGQSRVYAGDIFSPMITGNLVHTSTVVLRRTVLERVGGFDESLRMAGEDYDFHLRTCREVPVAFADVPTIRYQRGGSDQLTRPEYAAHRARNFLTTVNRALASEGSRISLPPGKLDEVMSEAHEWLAGASLDMGDHATARAEYRRALRQHPFRIGLLLRLGLTLMPVRAADRARRFYRAVKARLPLSKSTGP